jgi:hypothetical protein
MPKEHKVTLDDVAEIAGGEVRKAVDKYLRGRGLPTR